VNKRGGKGTRRILTREREGLGEEEELEERSKTTFDKHLVLFKEDGWLKRKTTIKKREQQGVRGGWNYRKCYFELLRGGKVYTNLFNLSRPDKGEVL